MSGSGINDIKPKIWDIIKAKVYFDDSMNYKERPVLVLDVIQKIENGIDKNVPPPLCL